MKMRLKKNKTGVLWVERDGDRRSEAILTQNCSMKTRDGKKNKEAAVSPRVDRFAGARSGFMSRTHRAGRRKSSPCQSASQIVLWIAMMVGKIWASQAENSFHLGWRYVHAQQFSSDPQIDDAPVRLGKALPNMPRFRPALINAGGSLGSNRGRLIAYARERVGILHRSRRLLCDHQRGRMQQVLGGAGEDCRSFNNLYPRSVTGGGASLELVIGEARQSSQVTPVGAGQVASVSVRQLFTDDRGYGRFQGRGANANPSLEMARAGLEHHTRFMAMGSHEGNNIGSGVIQVEENIAGIAMLSVGQKIDVITLKAARAQKAQHRSTCQLTNIPNSFAWARPTCEAMDQADEIEIIRHSRKLAADSVRSEEESAIKHEHENAIEAPRGYNDFSANGNNPLKAVSQSRGALHSVPLPLQPIPNNNSNSNTN